MADTFRRRLGAVLSLLVPCAAAFNPTAGDFTRLNASDVRVLEYNTELNFVSDASLTANEFTRIIGRVDPDIIAFAEIDSSLSAASIASQLQTITGDTWAVHRGLSDGARRCVLAARNGTRTSGFNLSIPLIQDTTPASEVRGVTAGLVDLAGTTDLYVMVVHFKAFSGTTENAQRQQAVDAIISWQRDARTAGGSITLPANTPMLVVGDMNFVGGSSLTPHVTIVNGDIFDESTYGADSPPDWDGTSSLDVMPADPNTLDRDTWSSTASSPSSRLDRFILTDSALSVASSFILNTRTMSPAARAAASPNLLLNDTANAADHLPVVVDFSPPATLVAGDILVNEFIVTPNASEAVEVLNTTAAPIDLSNFELRVGATTHTVDAGVTLPASGYVTLTPANTSASTPFLPNPGGALQLRAPGGALTLDTVSYGTLGAAPAPIFDESCARAPNGADTGNDGADWNLDDTPTMGAANNAPAADLGAGTVFLNEVYHNPAVASAGFIELHNAGGAPVDISGWQIIANDDHDVPASTTIAPLGFFTLTQPNYPPFMALGAAADNVYLLTNTGVRVDQVGWSVAGNNTESLAVVPDGNRTEWNSHDSATNPPDWQPRMPTNGGPMPVELSGFVAD